MEKALKIRYIRTHEYEVVLDLSDESLAAIVSTLRQDYDEIDHRYYRSFKEYLENTLFDMLYNEGYQMDSKAAQKVNNGIMLIRSIEIIE